MRQRRYPLFSNGKTRVRCWEKGERYDITLGRGDLVVLPPFLRDEVFNEGDNICHRQTLLARPQPLRPQYNDPELLKLQAAIPSPFSQHRTRVLPFENKGYLLCLVAVHRDPVA